MEAKVPTLTPNQEKLMSALKEADRVDRRILVANADGKKISVYTFRKYEYCPKDKTYGLYTKVASHNDECCSHLYGTLFLNDFVERFGDYEVVEQEKKNTPITPEDMADVIADGFDEEYYMPDENDDDEYGRDLGYGSKVSEVETEEEDFYARYEVDVTARSWCYPATYWEPEDSGCEVTRLKVSLLEAYRIDEEGDEHPLTDEEFKVLEVQLKKHLEVA